MYVIHIFLPVLYYQGNLYVTKGAYAGGRGFPLSLRFFLFGILIGKTGFFFNLEWFDSIQLDNGF